MVQQTIGRYEIRQELGEGGMGTVYLAYDPDLEREVALKVLQPQLFMLDSEYAARFEREVKTITALEHGSIVSLYEYGHDNEWHYFVMRLMRGGSLRDRIEEGPLSLQDANQIVQRVGSALAKAHRKGIVHRDLKPGNILFDEDGAAYLGDFGVVKVEDSIDLKTRTGQTLGTPHYMSPELIDGKQIDSRSDIYALGIVLYEMLTGSKPYDHDSSARVIVMQLTAPLPDVLAENPDLPPQVQAIIYKAMAKDPVDRYNSVDQFTRDLQAVVDAPPVTAAAVPPQQPAAKPVSETIAPPIPATKPDPSAEKQEDKSAISQPSETSAPPVPETKPDTSGEKQEDKSAISQPSETSAPPIPATKPDAAAIDQDDKSAISESSTAKDISQVERLSYGKAILHHLALGRGLFYVESLTSETYRRKYLYVAAFILTFLDFAVWLLYYPGFGFGGFTFLIFLAGFVDTLLLCRQQNKLNFGS